MCFFPKYPSHSNRVPTTRHRLVAPYLVPSLFVVYLCIFSQLVAWCPAHRLLPGHPARLPSASTWLQVPKPPESFGFGFRLFVRDPPSGWFPLLSCSVTLEKRNPFLGRPCLVGQSPKRMEKAATEQLSLVSPRITWVFLKIRSGWCPAGFRVGFL